MLEGGNSAVFTAGVSLHACMHVNVHVHVHRNTCSKPASLARGTNSQWVVEHRGCYNQELLSQSWFVFDGVTVISTVI